MFDLEYQGNITEASCVINYDTSDLHYAILESENSIAKAIDNYRKIGSTLLTEGASEQDIKLFEASSFSSIKERILKAIDTIKTFIMNKIKEIAAAISQYMTKTKADMGNVVSTVEKRLYAGDYDKGPTMSMYDYKPDHFKVVNLLRIDAVFIMPSTYDFTLNLRNLSSDSIDMMNNSIVGFNNLSAKQIQSNLLNIAARGYGITATENKLREAGGAVNFIHTTIRGVEAVRSFDKKYIAGVYSADKVKAESTYSLNSLISILDKLRSEIISFKYDETNEYADMIGRYLSAKLNLISTISSLATSINMESIKASIEYSNKCKQFVMKAYHYKKPEEK